MRAENGVSWPSRLRQPLAAGLFVSVLGGSIALGIESWPFSSYPMYSVPKTIEQVEFARFAFELDGGERVLWSPRFKYIAKDLNGMIERDRERPDFEARLRAAARLVLADLAHEGRIEEPSRIRRVLVLSRRIRPAAGGAFEADDRVVAAFGVETLR